MQKGPGMISEPTFARVDDYIARLFKARYAADRYAEILAQAAEAGLPRIHISASEGMVLHVLAKAAGARRILEIGTLGGYSGCWLASALPADGRLVTLEISAKHADVARANFERAGLADRVEVVVGPASETLEGMATRGEGGFDVTFIDADKDGYAGYLNFALKLTRRGGLILADNALSHGVLDGNTENGIARYNTAVAAAPSLTSAIVTTMRDEIDGLAISVVE